MSASDIDPFWVQNRAEFLAKMSVHADPNACGTCRSLSADGEPVKHDECQQRATLLQAPDHPYYEILAGFPLEENEKLPARFHIPVFDDCGKPNAWLCAVCWEDGVVTGWPCKTATEQGTKVFTPLGDAETAAKKQAASIRDEVLAEVVTWLTKKAREFRADGQRHQADTASLLASKVARGAVRPNNLRMLPPDFFEPDHVYAREHHGCRIEFHVRHVDVTPNGTRFAFGFRTEPCISGWAPMDSDDFTGWTEVAQAPVAQHYDKVPDPADGCHWCACGNRWPCKDAEAVAR